MSSSMNWEIVDKRPCKSLPTPLKFAFRKRFGEAFDVELSQINNEDLAWIEGLRDAEVDGADKLCKLIEKHGRIRVWESY